MATNAKYKVKNGSVWEQIHFETTPEQVIGLLDSGGKIDLDLLPEFIFSGGLSYFSAYGGFTPAQGAELVGSLAHIAFTLKEASPDGDDTPDEWFKGKYVILSKDLVVYTAPVTSGNELSGDFSWVAGATDDGEWPDGASNALYLEAGDFIVCDSWDTTETTVTATFSVVNNTYGDATTSKQGVVTLTAATTYAGLSSTNKVITETALKSIVFPVSAGGTGKSSFTANRLLLGNGTGSISEVDHGSDGHVLKLVDGQPTWRPEIVDTYSITTGDSNGYIKYNVNGGTYTDVKVKGINTAAYREEGYFAQASHGHGNMDKDGKFAKEVIIKPANSSGGAAVKLGFYEPESVATDIIHTLPGSSGLILSAQTNPAPGSFYTASTNPSSNHRLNYNGILHAKDFAFYRGSTAHNPNVVIVATNTNPPTIGNYKDGDVWIAIPDN